MRDKLMSFESEKTAHISLSCKLVPVPIPRDVSDETIVAIIPTVFSAFRSK